MLRSNFYDYKINKLSFSLHKVLYKIVTVKNCFFQILNKRILIQKINRNLRQDGFKEQNSQSKGESISIQTNKKMMTLYSICLKHCARQTFYRTKTTLPLDVRCFTGLTDPGCKVSNIFCSIAFLVNSYLTSIKYVMHFCIN